MISSVFLEQFLISTRQGVTELWTTLYKATNLQTSPPSKVPSVTWKCCAASFCSIDHLESTKTLFQRSICHQPYHRSVHLNWVAANSKASNRTLREIVGQKLTISNLMNLDTSLLGMRLNQLGTVRLLRHLLTAIFLLTSLLIFSRYSLLIFPNSA